VNQLRRNLVILFSYEKNLTTDARPPRTQPILACFVRYSWTYDTERVKHVIGLMGAPIFFHVSYGTYGTLSYSESVELGGIKLRRDKAVFRNSR
jgi:hypothetical protein